MPMLDGNSPKVISHNIRELIAAGYTRKEAVAIALDHARRTAPKKGRAFGGRTGQVPYRKVKK